MVASRFPGNAPPFLDALEAHCRSGARLPKLEGARSLGTAPRLHLQQREAEPDGDDLEGVLSFAWQRVQQPRLPGVIDELREAARRWQSAALVAELATLHAVHAALQADPLAPSDEALRIVRRASRMTRTEAMRPLEFYANLALARLRRLRGNPHLSNRILRTLRQLSATSPWLHWEQIWGGESLPRAAEPPQSILQGCVNVLRQGQGPLHEHFAQLPEGNSPWLAELRSLREATGFGDGAFRRGQAPLPALLRGVASGWRTPTEGSRDGVRPRDGFRASVMLRPDAPAQRLLTGALPFHPEAPTLSETGNRTLRALSVLAFADGLSEEDFFAQVYRFPFEPEKHKAILAVLLHRTRNALGNMATLSQENGLLRLDTHSPICFGDPSCAEDDRERILSFIAEGNGSAKAIAERAGIPLRTAQEVLKTLVEDGACQRERKGRSIEYALEDTTFQEPTDLTPV